MEGVSKRQTIIHSHNLTDSTMLGHNRDKRGTQFTSERCLKLRYQNWYERRKYQRTQANEQLRVHPESEPLAKANRNEACGVGGLWGQCHVPLWLGCSCTNAVHTWHGILHKYRIRKAAPMMLVCWRHCLRTNCMLSCMLQKLMLASQALLNTKY